MTSASSDAHPDGVGPVSFAMARRYLTTDIFDRDPMMMTSKDVRYNRSKPRQPRATLA